MRDLISINPWTGATVWQGEIGDATTAAVAVERGHRAMHDWSRQPAAERIAVLNQVAACLSEDAEAIAQLICQESGKALWEARQEAGALAAKCGHCVRAWEDDAAVPPGAAGRWRRPVGLSLVLGPFNFPAHLPNGWIMAALLAGNAVIFKPSEQCPAVAEALVAAYHRAGLHPDLLQVVQGDAGTAERLIAHPRLAAVYLTGSRRAGVAVHRQLAGRPEVLLALEMGGNNPLVVWDADDPQAAARLIIRSAFITAGQRCVCARRLILPRNAFGDAVCDALVAAMPHLRIGDPAGDPAVFHGPLIHAAAADAAVMHGERLLEQGGRLLVDGLVRRNDHAALVAPTLIEIPDGVTLADEECFAPLLSLHRVETFEAACRAAAQTRYGLAAGLVTRDAVCWQRFVDLVPAGIVNRNTPITGASGGLPFGGLGASGNHRPAGYAAGQACSDVVASLVEDDLGEQAIAHGWEEES